MRGATDRVTRAVSPALLAANAATLQRLGARQFSLTAVAEAAGVSRGTVHNALGSRDHAIKTALDHLASVFIEAIAAEVDKESKLADQVAAAAVLVCAHRAAFRRGGTGRDQRKCPGAAAAKHGR